MVGSSGLLYGVTPGDGTHNYGTIFSISTGGAFTPLYAFTTAASPQYALVADPSGNLYGTTETGGTHNLGTIFQLDPFNGVFTTLWNCSAADCANPIGGLLQASDGNGYGLSTGGGAGSVYRVIVDSGVTLVHGFSASDTAAGIDTYGGLVENSTGLWGFTAGGGSAGDGTLFQLTPTGVDDGYTFASEFSFDGTDGTGLYYGPLTLGGDGNLYGATFEGGSDNDGTVFQYSPTGESLAAYYSFTGSPGGFYPFSAPIEATDGSLWGATAHGGANGAGAIYKVTVSTPIAPAISLTANPTTVAVGSPSTITYSVNNAYSTTAQQCYFFLNGDGFGAAATSGTTTFTPEYGGTNLISYMCGGVETATAVINTTGEVTMTSTSHNFGNVNVSQSAVYGVEITNTMATPLTNTGIVLTGSSEFTEMSHCPPSLPAGANCETVFTFAPTATGTVTAQWYLNGTPGGTTFNPSNGGTLTATGVTNNSVTLTTNGHNFGDVTVGSTSPIYGTVLTNGTNAAISLAFTGVTSPFVVTGNNCGATLPAGISCNLQFDFSPQADVTSQQTFGITATQNGSPVTITANGVVSTGVKLTGTGN
jgi:uncharacterized repeat protein (TIGR03803 family)